MLLHNFLFNEGNINQLLLQKTNNCQLSNKGRIRLKRSLPYCEVVCIRIKGL